MLAYYVALKTIYNQPVHDVKSVALYGGSIYLIFGIPLYIGLFDVLKSKVPPSYSGVIYIGCIILSGVLLTLLVVLLGGGKVQQLISSESSLFGIYISYQVLSLAPYAYQKGKYIKSNV